MEALFFFRKKWGLGRPAPYDTRAAPLAGTEGNHKALNDEVLIQGGSRDGIYINPTVIFGHFFALHFSRFFVGSPSHGWVSGIPPVKALNKLKK